LSVALGKKPGGTGGNHDKNQREESTRTRGEELAKERGREDSTTACLISGCKSRGGWAAKIEQCRSVRKMNAGISVNSRTN